MTYTQPHTFNAVDQGHHQMMGSVSVVTDAGAGDPAE